MKKSDLVAGKHVVKYQNGSFRFVGKDGDLKDDESEVVSNLVLYNARLGRTDTAVNEYDIVAVYELNEVWKREDPTITEAEKTILLNLPSNYEWIARDKNGELYLYQGKPEKSANAWESKCVCHRSLDLFNHLFKMVKWEDDEPWNTEDLLKLEVKKDG